VPELVFKGKEFVYNHHLSVPFRPLVVHADKGIGDASLDDNLIIHGDNLHALKALLPRYAGKVDCIFIDPPYNTGNEGWSYNDNVNSPMLREWLNSNPITIEDGLRHDKWAAMMYPRLRLLHELLADDGVLFVTIDDNEQHHLREMLDEIFSQDNGFYAHIAWQKKYSPANDATGFSAMHDHILVYRKSQDFTRNLLERSEQNDSNYRHEDERGVFRVSDYTCNKTADERPNLFYPITNPLTGEEVWPKRTRVWAYSQLEHARHAEEDLVWWGPDGRGSTPGFKRYRHMLRGGGGVVPGTWWTHEFAGHTDEAKKELREIMAGEEIDFFTPKPVRLLSRILEVATDEDSIILDSFAGSATTAHAVLAANATDGGNRKFILVEMEDYADSLTAERVRRAIKGYSYTGTQRDELLREKITWTKLRQGTRLLEQVTGLENSFGPSYDAIRKSVTNGELVVTGEKKVEERAEGLGGTFTYCTLGDPIDMDSLLTGESLPSYEALASVLFHTATNTPLPTETMETDALGQPGHGYLGEAAGAHVWLIYQPDLEFLKSSDAALTLAKARSIAETREGRHVVFAPARFVSQKMLNDADLPVEFAPLPFALYRVERE